jgi:lysine-N-methylase
MSRITLTDPGQKFACRDCPARCCQVPWRYTITAEEERRIRSYSWVPERLASAHTSFEHLPGGMITLPTVEKDRMLRCAFLDDDNLCSIHKREGIDATPQTCQTFPFGFIEKEDGSLQTYLSHLCPSIRDNYGDPLSEILPEKAERMKDLAPLKLVPHLRLGQGTIRQTHYLEWADQAARILESGEAPSTALLKIRDWTALLAAGVPENQIFSGNLQLSEIPQGELIPPLPAGQWARSIRLLLATCFVPVSYPKRVGSRRQGTARIGVFLAGLDFVRQMVQQKGKADLLFLPRPADLQAAFSLPSPSLSPAAKARLARFLGQLLVRRNFFLGEKSLEEIVFLLALAGSVTSVFARLKAASENRTACTVPDLADGESLAELLLTYHGSMVHSMKALEVLTTFMASYPPSFRGLVETY